jgi:hypothetical protein
MSLDAGEAWGVDAQTYGLRIIHRVSPGAIQRLHFDAIS